MTLPTSPTCCWKGRVDGMKHHRSMVAKHNYLMSGFLVFASYETSKEYDK